MRYRKKPVEIEALEFTEENAKDVADWSGGYIGRNDLTADPYIRLPTLEGIMTANVGDYIIKGVKGEFYPCKPDIFELTYDYVGENINASVMTVTDMVDNEDGSCNIGFEMSYENMKIFAGIGMTKVLIDAANRTISEFEDDTFNNVGC